MKLLPPIVFLRAFRTAAIRFASSARDLQSRALRIGTAVLLAATALPALAALPVDRIKLPPGFHIEVLSSAVPSARAMALSPEGVLYIGSLDGHVYALELQNGRVTARHVIASGLETPAGVAWHNGALYVSAVSKIVRFDAIDTHLNDPPKPVVVIDTLPTETHHGWKFIAFGPDGKLYVPQGAPCNVCLKDRNRFALIGR
ncbi:MAG: PQQ-dependent sugar dehydrogenase, partial [Paraburkholderia nemoris]